MTIASKSSLRSDRKTRPQFGALSLGLSVITTLACSSLLSSAYAVEFFKDGFERTTLNDGIPQNKLGNGGFYFNNTLFWESDNKIEVQGNGVDGFNAYSGNNRVELDSDRNSSMKTKVNLENGKTYVLNFQYRSRPKTDTTVKRNCILLFCWPTTTTSTTYVGGGLRAIVESPTYSSGFVYVGDVSNWTKSSTKFTYWGTTGEVTLKFEATGTSDGIGTVLDEVSLETDISGNPEVPEALIGIEPPHVPGMTGNDTRRSDIITPIVVNKQAAIALGKALFWDQAVGSDQMACASCHFSAGADSRIKNQIDPGVTNPAATGKTFENTASGAKSGPNYTLTKADFPFPRSSDDVASSSGTFSGAYKNFKNGANEDDCARVVGGIFHVNGVGTRNVEPRNTPTMINAAFNFRNFWDGRANNVFNGVSPFGLRDTAAGVFVNKTTGLSKQKLNLKNASLASQAVGPVGSDLEMACRGRQFADVGRKLLSRKPLALQSVAADDSVLAGLPATLTYADAVRAAFAPEYWNGNCNGNCGTPGAGVTPSGAYNHMEANFSMFFGLAVQLYEETLISDDTKFDRYKRGQTTLTESEKRGEDTFNSSTCHTCHKGPTMSNVAILQRDENVIEGMLDKNNLFSIYDRGFYNIGVVPTSYDLGVGGVDPWNNPLSFTRQYISNVFVDKFGVEECKFEDVEGLCNDNSAFQRSLRRATVNGAFKVPTLRNVALTGPYMHNGSLSTLEQVVDFYNRGGNFNNPELHPDIKPLGFSAQQKADLVAFLKTLTDDRVAYEKAPFDHPSLLVPNGHVGDQNRVEAGNYLSAVLGKDEVLTVPAVGRNGNANPLKPFVEQLADSPINTQVGHTAGSIAAGNDGTVLVTNSANNSIWKYNADNNWSQLPGAAISVAVVNANRYFAVGPDFLMWRSDNSGAWYQVGNNAKVISAASDGTVIGTTKSDTIWVYNSNTKTYVNLPGLAKAVAAVDANNLFHIGTDNAVYRYNAGAWVKVGVDAAGIAASSDGTVLVSNIYDNRIWKYIADNNWVSIPSTSKINAVIANNRYFVIGTDGNVYRN